LREGEAVGIFPEAGISYTYAVRALMPGTAALARDTGAPIVPLALWGMQRIASVGRPVDGKGPRPSFRRGRRVDVAFGAPLSVAPDEDVVAATQRLGLALTDLLEGLQRHPAHLPRPGEHAPWYPAHLGGHAPDRAEALGLDEVPRTAVPPSWGPAYDAEMNTPDPKTTLVDGLARLQAQVLGKLAGLSEYDLRRPVTPSGTNLLGVVKHLASVQAGYFGATFGRPFPQDLPWLAEDAEVNADMWVTPEESTASVTDLYGASWEHAQGTFGALDLDATGKVPWWPPERRVVTLHQILVHVTTETARHAGHLDIVRETIDGDVGRYEGDPNVPGFDLTDWAAYRAKVEAAARAAAD
jgi:hypothetical protein